MLKVGVIGLGNMGAGMALSIARAGMTVSGFDPATAFQAELEDAGVVLHNTIADLSAGIHPSQERLGRDSG